MAAAATGRLAGRIALITGASRGLGAAAARGLASEGAHCVLVARTVGGLEAVDDQIKALGGDGATLVPLDVTDGPGIDRLGAALYERFGRLDILLGNAGMLGTLSPVGHIEPAIFERVMAVNVTANWRLIRSLDPLLRQSDAGRAIFVTSGVCAPRRSPTGAPTPPARRRSTCWSASMPPRSRTPRCASTCSIPARPAPACAREAFPGENPADAAAARGACRGADPPRPARLHHERRMGGGRRNVIVTAPLPASASLLA